jgi:TonB family protein
VITVDGVASGKSPIFLPGLTAGTHTIKVSRPGFSPAELSLELAAGTPAVPLRFTLQPLETSPGRDEGAIPPAVATNAKRAPDARQGLEPPRRIAGEVAVYPEAARRLRLEGTVALDILVDPKGIPTQMRVVRSAGELLDEAVLSAARTWRFEPARRDGTPVSARYPYRHRFERSGA